MSEGSRGIVAILLFCPALSLLAPAAFAAGDCERALLDAERSYRGGRLEEVLVVEEACIEGRASRDQRIQAYALIAKVRLALDDDEAATEAVKALVRLDPAYRPAASDPIEFAALVAAHKSSFTVNVGTVSKTDEPLREAPATVIVVTAEEIERRGYLDLEQLLHDLPGFDISRGNGEVYSNVYMRGYRSDRSDRMLFLIDGVEQNDLHSNTAYISRQIPLSNIAQVEVVYGPASTIYGPNAFTGVVSVTTRSPRARIAEDRAFGVHAQLAGGSFGTEVVDATVAGTSGDERLAWSITGRVFRSDEPDLSAYPEWNYDILGDLSEVDYQEVMRIDGALARALGEGDVADFWCPFTGYCEVVEENGEIVAIELTEAGAEEARRRDLELFGLLLDVAAANGIPRGFVDETDDWAVDAELELSNFSFGIQTWRREEGTTPWYTDFLRTGAGNTWTPKQTTLHARYSQPVGSSLLVGLFSRYKQHELDGDSTISRLLNYAAESLNIVELVVFDTTPSLQQLRFDQRSTQFRNELSLVYEPSSRFNLVGGVELRESSVQLEFESEIVFQVPPGFPFFLPGVLDVNSDQTDVGLYLQTSLRPRDDLKVVLGGRLDSSSLRETEARLLFEAAPPAPGLPTITEEQVVELQDSGTVFNPRLAVVHTRGPLVLKAIYAEAFKEPSNLQRFSREPGVREFSNPGLEAERVRNLEVGFNWQSGADFFVDVAAYQASYSNAVSLQRAVDPNEFPSDSGRFENIGRLEIRGLQAHAVYRHGRYDFHGNYTYTDPTNTDPVDGLGNPLPGDLRIGDIASHRFNLGASASFGEHWQAHLRGNYVGARDTGEGTTVRDNPLTEIDAYFVAHAAVGYRGLLPGATLQLIVNNLFDAGYEHPGVQRAGVGFAARLPQPERAVYLRLSFKR